MRNDLFTMFKAFIIGSSMSVPGVSGGTMAIVLGLYDRLIEATSNFFADIKNNIKFLIQISLGAVVGIGSLSFVLKWLLKAFPFILSFFFVGAIIGGIPALYKKIRESEKIKNSYLFFVLGFVLVVLISCLPDDVFNISMSSGITYYLIIAITGIIISVTLVLPGISSSHMLLILGMYDSLLIAITEFNIVFLAILGISALIGIFIVSKPIAWTMKNFPGKTYWLIMGFVLGSILEIVRKNAIPYIPDQASLKWWSLSLGMGLIMFVIGFGFIRLLSKKSKQTT